MSVSEHRPRPAQRGAVLYVTLEYCLEDLFSGNGVCARSQVRGIAKNNFQVHVICGRPLNPPPPLPADTPRKTAVYECPLKIWRTTDRYADHEKFAHAAAAVLEDMVDTNAELMQSLHAVMLVDWTGDAAVEVMDPAKRNKLLAATPVFFLNFRVYARMTNISEEDREWYRKAEVRSVRRAVDSGGGVMSLSTTDDDELREMYGPAAPTGAFKVILPMLRAEFSAVARRDRDLILDSGRQRKYLVCLVRLSKDKGAQRFVDICEAITVQDPGIWERVGVVPLMAGAASQPDFADGLKKRFKATVPSGVVVDQFLNSMQLSQILVDSVLNIHPSLYEAYGMTIVEAGSCGVPSVINAEGIGASQLLRPEEKLSFAVDMFDVPGVSRFVSELLNDVSRTGAAGRAAYAAATSWTEDEHVKLLLSFVDFCKMASVPSSASE